MMASSSRLSEPLAERTSPMASHSRKSVSAKAARRLALPLLAAALWGCSAQQAANQAAPANGAAPAPAPAANTGGPVAAGDPAAAPGGFASSYTRVDLAACPIIEQIEEGASATWRCPGHAGIPLIVMTGDERMDVDAGVDNDQWESQSPFNGVGEQVEWRLHQGRPIAIIFRLNLSYGDGRTGSVLAVETIGRPGAPGCQMGLVQGNFPHANAAAREIADTRATNFRCGRDTPVERGTPPTL
jgi:hypothetical protein